MKYLKYFESSTTQQPFFLKNDRLYISDEIAKSITPTYTQLKLEYRNRDKYFYERCLKEYTDFFNNTKNEKGYRISRQINTLYSVTYGQGYRMNIEILLGNQQSNDAGQFQYYISGRSGDSEMHGKNMKRATRESNLNFMIKLYPIVKYIKIFYTRLKTEGFFEIIKDAIIRDNSVVNDGAPDELIDDEDVGHIINGYKYNI